MLVLPLLLASVFVFAGQAGADQPQSSRYTAEELRQGQVDDHVVVRFKSSANQAQKASALDAVESETIDTSPNLPNTRLLEVGEGVSVKAAIQELESRSSVLYAEPNFIRTIDAVPNDTNFSSLWGMRNTGQAPENGTPGMDINAVNAWDRTTGSSAVRIAVIDTGIDGQHPDLNDNINVGAGRNFDWQNSSSSSTDWDDRNGHGTHVAGTIGAEGNNGQGVAGVSWDVELIPIKVCDFDGYCDSWDVSDGMAYAGTINADAANISLGGSQPSQSELDAIEDNPDTLFVTSAGNGGGDGVGDDNDVTPSYPCNFTSTNILCVAAIDADGELAEFSNYGGTSVDVAAPGVNVVSTYPKEQVVWQDDFSTGMDGWSWNGTGGSWSVVNGRMTFNAGPNGTGINDLRLDQVIDMAGMENCRFELDLQFDLPGDESFSWRWTKGQSLDYLEPWLFFGGVVPGDFVYTYPHDMSPADGQNNVGLSMFYGDSDGVTEPGAEIAFDNAKVICHPVAGGYAQKTLSGTSMATPHATGTAALAFAANADATVSQVKSAIMNGSTPQNNLDVRSGGRIDASEAVERMNLRTECTASNGTVFRTGWRKMPNATIDLLNMQLKSPGQDRFQTFTDYWGSVSKLEWWTPDTLSHVFTQPGAWGDYFYTGTANSWQYAASYGAADQRSAILGTSPFGFLSPRVSHRSNGSGLARDSDSCNDYLVEWPPYVDQPTNIRTAILGDSMVTQMAKKLINQPGYRPVLEPQSGSSYATMRGEIRGMAAGPQETVLGTGFQYRPDKMVITLGTKDADAIGALSTPAARTAALNTFKSNVDGALADTSLVPCRILVTVHQTGWKADGSYSAEQLQARQDVNAKLRAVATASSSVDLVDWQALSAGHEAHQSSGRWYEVADRDNPNPAGLTALSNAIINEAQGSCS